MDTLNKNRWVRTIISLLIPIVVIFPFQMLLTYLFDNFVDPGFSGGVTYWKIIVIKWGYPFLQMLVTMLPVCWLLTTSAHDNNTVQNIISYLIPLIYIVGIILFFYSFRGVSRAVGSIQVPMALLVPYVIKLICITKNK